MALLPSTGVGNLGSLFGPANATATPAPQFGGDMSNIGGMVGPYEHPTMLGPQATGSPISAGSGNLAPAGAGMNFLAQTPAAAPPAMMHAMPVTPGAMSPLAQMPQASQAQRGLAGLHPNAVRDLQQLPPGLLQHLHDAGVIHPGLMDHVFSRGQMR